MPTSFKIGLAMNENSQAKHGLSASQKVEGLLAACDLKSGSFITSFQPHIVIESPVFSLTWFD